MKQKDIFLQSEGDAYFDRNYDQKKKDYSKDPVVLEVLHIEESATAQPDYTNQRVPLNILEVGCGDGQRLSWLASKIDCNVYGIEPSEKASSLAASLGVKTQIGTAESLPYDAAQFDILIFGFCLYLCDQEDLFLIAKEADRVIKKEGWIIIHDFYAPTPVKRPYHHKEGVYSHKMDYSSLFTWHPFFTCFSKKVYHHGQSYYTDNQNEWVATQVIRKKVVSND